MKAHNMGLCWIMIFVTYTQYSSLVLLEPVLSCFRWTILWLALVDFDPLAFGVLIVNIDPDLNPIIFPIKGLS